MQTPSRSLVLLSGYTYTSAVLIVSILFWAFGLPGMLLHAEASQLTSVRDILSTTKPGVSANHILRFGTPTGVPADGSTIEVDIPAGFDVSTITEDDVDVTDDGVDLTTDTVCGAVQAAVSVSGQKIIIEICTGGGGAIAATSVIEVEIGLQATFSGAGAHQITNHINVGEYAVGIGGTMEDEGFTRIVIMDTVEVSGVVENFLDFEIAGVGPNKSVNADAILTFASTTATSMPFGLVTPSTEYVLAQDLSVSTNSKNGFMVTVFTEGDLVSTTGASINSFADGTGVEIPEAWSEPASQSGSPDTYGHWGVTSEDTTLSDDDSFGDALYAGNFVSNPREVMFATSSADGTTPGIGATRVGYKMEISMMQEAATDYRTQLVYIVTPVF